VTAGSLRLLQDGSLSAHWEAGLHPFIARWLPLLPPDEAGTTADGASAIRVVHASSPAPAAPSDAPLLRLGGASMWLPRGASSAVFLGSTGATFGTLDLASGDAVLSISPVAEDPQSGGIVDADSMIDSAPSGGEARTADEAAMAATRGGSGDAVGDADSGDAGLDEDAVVVAYEVYSMATLAAALVAGRMGRALVHAAAVVAPDGGTWLLVGDTHSGKTTTTVNLLNAGWRYVSDDHVVLGRGADGRVTVEGWPRRFHLDEGWAAGTPGQPRAEVDPRDRWPGSWLRSAPLAGILAPRVAAAEPTRLAPLPAADALAALIRQSPWLLADRAAAPAVLALLQSAAGHPAFALRVGLDAYRDASAVIAQLRAAVAQRTPSTD
jgi:hypothetical protein